MGYEFKYTKKLLPFMLILLVIVSLFEIIATIIMFKTGFTPNYFYMYWILISILFLITNLIYYYVSKNHIIWAIKKHLKNYDDLDDRYIIDEILDDLKEAFEDWH